MMPAEIVERGNGFPDPGDYVAGDDGELYRIVSMSARIETNGAGVGSSIRATVELANWGDVESDDEVHPSLAVL